MSDILFITQWWLLLFYIGVIFFPLTALLFPSFLDRGYLFSKVLGVLLLSYTIFLLGIFHIAPFHFYTILTVLFIAFGINSLLLKKNFLSVSTVNKKLLVAEELLFLATFLFWVYIRGHEPSIQGLEKYMDFGFINSILRSEYFPPKDMWFAPLSINYYYFGHLVTAVLTKISSIPAFITFNLMVATLFAFTFSLSFSIGLHLLTATKKLTTNRVVQGILAGFLVSLGGNLHTLYAFFTSYPADNPLPFWNLAFSLQTFPNDYWYPNATRFIPFTIHEFPIYSFVVSDLHGHVLDIPFVLLTIALLLSIYKTKNVHLPLLILLSLVIAVLYMTNAWDGAIYLTLSFLIFLLLFIPRLRFKGSRTISLFKKISISLPKNIQRISNTLLPLFASMATLVIGFFLFSLPFSLHFSPFVSGVGVICAPDFLTHLGKLGPLLFEQNHCQRSVWWQFFILHGFFLFFGAVFIYYFLTLKIKVQKGESLFVLALLFLSLLLLLAPEFIYVKDIYPQHYRANTMFKLGYQAFIMLSLVSSAVIISVIKPARNTILMLASIVLLVSIFAYPYFAISSYYNNLSAYKGLNGLAYLDILHPYDKEAIDWINKNINGQPIMVEAQGESYTDYERISANTGLPTIMGWTVHEWLWRGTYEMVSPRINEVKTIYEGTLPQARAVLKKYNVSYIYVGNLEREKYPFLKEEQLQTLGSVIYQNPGVTIYKVRN